VHGGLHDADLLPVTTRELPDRPVEDDLEPCAQLVAEVGVHGASKPGERVELLATRQAVREPEVAREVADALSRGDGVGARVEPEEHGMPARGTNEAEQQADRRALAGSVRPEVSEDLATLDPDVEVDERLDAAVVRLRQTGGLDRGHVAHAAIVCLSVSAYAQALQLPSTTTVGRRWPGSPAFHPRAEPRVLSYGVPSRERRGVR
jgi:hypothetical protein